MLEIHVEGVSYNISRIFNLLDVELVEQLGLLDCFILANNLSRSTEDILIISSCGTSSACSIIEAHVIFLGRHRAIKDSVVLLGLRYSDRVEIQEFVEEEVNIEEVAIIRRHDDLRQSLSC